MRQDQVIKIQLARKLGLVGKAGYPGTRVVPATSWLLSLLALKLTRHPAGLPCR